MLSPAFLPDYLSRYCQAQNDAALLNMLIAQPLDLIHFFEKACEDETWSVEHAEFMRAALVWMSDQYLEGKLSQASARRILELIQAHYQNLQEMIPLNVTVSGKNYSKGANSLLLAIESPILHELITINPEKNQLNLPEHPPDDIDLIIESVHRGVVENLWRKDRKELFRILRFATELQMSTLMKECQETLKRYIQEENVLELLFICHKERWKFLEQSCLGFLNNHITGIALSLVQEEIDWRESEKIQPLAFEFLDFNTTALNLFEEIKEIVTHLVFSGALIEETAFKQIITNAPKLISLNISYTGRFSEYLFDVPESLEELNLSQCSWLSPNHLKAFIHRFPSLKGLTLMSDTQLNYLAWGELRYLNYLKGLNLARCRQIRDEEFAVIVKACPRITHLNVEECEGLTKRAFFEMVRSWPQLISLNLSRCAVTDGLMLEIGSYCKALRSINVSRCLDITDKGLLQFAQTATRLQAIDLSGCRLSKEGVEQLRHARPNLEIKF